MARLAVERLRGDQAVDAAVLALTRGADSPALRILAGLSSPDLADALPYLKAAASELQVGPMERPGAARFIAYAIARDILAGRISPHDGANAIWSEAYYDVIDQHELDAFVADADSLDEAPLMRVTDPELWDGLIKVAELSILASAAELVARYEEEIS